MPDEIGSNLQIHLGDLKDVERGAPQDGDAILFDAARSMWVPGAVDAGGGGGGANLNQVGEVGTWFTNETQWYSSGVATHNIFAGGMIGGGMLLSEPITFDAVAWQQTTPGSVDARVVVYEVVGNELEFVFAGDPVSTDTNGLRVSDTPGSLDAGLYMVLLWANSGSAGACRSFYTSGVPIPFTRPDGPWDTARPTGIFAGLGWEADPPVTIMIEPNLASLNDVPMIGFKLG